MFVVSSLKSLITPTVIIIEGISCAFKDYNGVSRCLYIAVCVQAIDLQAKPK
jgi:hypothetical protein